MTEKPTDELNELLLNTDIGDYEQYCKDNNQYLIDGERSFYEYYKSVIKEKKIKLRDVYISADVSESYGGKIIRMENKHTTDRDLIIRLCLGGHFNWIETNRALKLYGFSELYAKIPRDALIIIAINERKYDIHKLNSLLESNGFDRLSMSE